MPKQPARMINAPGEQGATLGKYQVSKVPDQKHIQRTIEGYASIYIVIYIYASTSIVNNDDMIKPDWTDWTDKMLVSIHIYIYTYIFGMHMYTYMSLHL